MSMLISMHVMFSSQLFGFLYWLFQISDGAGFGRSLFERLTSLNHPKHLLNIQYRMHPSISLFPNLQFYRSQILNGANVKSKSYEKHYLPGTEFGPYSFINIIGGQEEFIYHSCRNMVEVSVVIKILQKLHRGMCCRNLLCYII